MNISAKELISRHIGQAIAKQRKAVGMTQAELAERLDLTIDAVSRLERGNVGLSVLRLLELAEIFGCETADLLESGSSRARDQARQIELMLDKLNDAERLKLVQLIGQLVEWKSADRG